MKTILGIVGSPRKDGNTHILLSKILEGAKAAGAATELILLSDSKIGECDGCHACWKGRRCSKNDDMIDIYPKIIASDVIVFGTPVYWYGPTALMKAFVDRFVYFNSPKNRALIRGKEAAIAVPLEEKNPSTAALVEAFFEKSLAYLEMKLIGRVIAPGVGEKGEILAKKKVLAEAYELGRSMAQRRS